jgi:hypothetical protein
MKRTTTAPRIFGAALMLAGSGMYLADVANTGRNLHIFVVPSLVLMGLGALFAITGARTPSTSQSVAPVR